MKLLPVILFVSMTVLQLSCRPQVVEVVDPTPSELASAIDAAEQEVGDVPKEKEQNPNLVGMGTYKYQIDAFIDGSYERQCSGQARGEVMRNLDVKFTETTECAGGVLHWVVDLNQYMPDLAQTSPFTIDSKLMPYFMNISNVSSKKEGEVETLHAIHVDLGEFDLMRRPCPPGFCERFKKLGSMMHYWEIHRTPKSADGLREGIYLAAQTLKSGTAVLLKAIFSGTFQMPDNSFSMPLRMTVELNDLQEQETK